MSQKPHSVLEDIGAIIGYTATAALADWFGGANLWVPAIAEESHPIAKVIGMSAFRLLVKEYAGQSFWLPMDYQRERDRRDRMIGAFIVLGMSHKNIAGIAGVTERHVALTRGRLEEQGLIPLILRHAKIDDAVKFVPHTRRQAKTPQKKRG